MTITFDVRTPSGKQAMAVEEGTSTFFVGANGSGKTRLAAEIEEALGERAHRIAAHRALTLNADVPKVSEGQALKTLRYGTYFDGVSIHHRPGSRYGSNAATHLLNDFDALLQTLFAEQSNTALVTHKSVRAGGATSAEPTKFERLADIWDRVLPHRKLKITGDNVLVQVAGTGAEYSGRDMSDGERAAFYLLGQALVAAPDSLLIFDEPELHLHRSILGKLWSEIEAARPDCGFIVITHDLEFATGQVATLYVLRAYDPATGWVIEPVPESGFDEETATLILGSRRPILFVEGGESSLDLAIYRACYPTWTILPRGGCANVIHSVATMRANASLTRITCAGIVDADDYSESDKTSLEKLGIAVLPVAEIENLFLLPTVLEAIGKIEELPRDEIARRTKALVDEILNATGDKVVAKAIARYLRRRIDRAVKALDFTDMETVDEIAAAFEKNTKELDIQEIAKVHADRIRGAIEKKDLAEIAKWLDEKFMLTFVGKQFRNTNKSEFEAWIARKVGSTNTPELRDALQSVLPKIKAL
ncbi:MULTISPECIES: AAA family ATPase [unclassified Ensifer]|uniref:AAA family ATPase n=1 Tax=unclassified Ensifer TaxID=2633371 RepID=UPI00300FB3A9